MGDGENDQVQQVSTCMFTASTSQHQESEETAEQVDNNQQHDEESEGLGSIDAELNENNNQVRALVDVTNAGSSEGNPSDAIVIDGAFLQIEQLENSALVNIKTGLLEYLKKKTGGKEVIKLYNKYQKDKRPMPRFVRSKLTRLVIEREKDWILKDVTPDQQVDKFIITQERFKILANEIESIFKGETASSYYRIEKRGNKTGIAGKLWGNYNYTKDTLKASLILKSKVPNVSAPITNEEIICLDWLNSSAEPWDKVKSYWSKSFAARRQLLQSNITTSDYIDRFLCLRLEQGKELFALDFFTLYTENILISYDKWKIVKQGLVLYLDDAKIKNVVDLGYKNVLTSGELSEDKENFILFHLLPYILPPKRCGKRKRTVSENDRPHKLSLQERRESFILQVKTAADIEPALLDLKDKLQKNRQTFQPTIVAVGSVTRIQHYYVAVNEQLYEVASILEAITLAVQVFFSLDCSYPEASQIIWVFLQKILFNINLVSDIVNVESNAIIGYIQGLLKESQ